MVRNFQFLFKNLFGDKMMSTFNFIEGPVIAHGGFGRVCSGVLNGEQVVSKRMLTEDESLNEDFNIELNNCLELAREPNTNVMLLKGFINASPIKLMIFEKAKTDLGRFHMELLQLNKTFTLKQFVSIFAHIINGLNYIYSKGYIHRDIKPENILLVDGIAKISDLGLATLLDREVSLNISMKTIDDFSYREKHTSMLVLHITWHLKFTKLICEHRVME